MQSQVFGLTVIILSGVAIGWGSTIAAGFVANGDTPPTVSRSQEEDLPDLSNSRGLTMIFLCMKNSYTEIFAFYKVVGRRYMFKALN